MSRKLNREAFRKLIAEDIAWLMEQPRTLEREHILVALQEAEKFHYDLCALLRRTLDEVIGPLAEGHSKTVDELRAWVEQLEGPHGD